MNQFTAITERQNAIILGGLLGDLHVQKTRAETGTCRLRFSQNIKQKNYLYWKYENLKANLCKTTSPPKLEIRDRKVGVCYAYTFYTSYLSELVSLREKWYIPQIKYLENGDSKINFVKTVPSDLNKILTNSLALAVWYLDDGTKRMDTESCRLATQSFSKEENVIIRDCLLQNFGIESTIEDWGRNKEGKTTYQIAILSSKNGGGFDKFRNLIKPIVAVEVPSMLYKFSKTP